MGDSDTLPSKVLLLAVHLATHLDIEGLAKLATQYPETLSQSTLLRILLTYLPETARPALYVQFLQDLYAGNVKEEANTAFDTSPVSHLTDGRASKQVKTLHLLQLSCDDGPLRHCNNEFVAFLYMKVCRIDEEAGLLTYLPELLGPFLHLDSSLSAWALTTVLPYVRRNAEYYTESSMTYSLREFQYLSDATATDYLLARTVHENQTQNLGRDLRGLVMPFLYNESRWQSENSLTGSSDDDTQSSVAERCLGWEHLLEWLMAQASGSWAVAEGIFEQWEGPQDVDFGSESKPAISASRQSHLKHSFGKALLALAYTVQGNTVESLTCIFRMIARTMALFDHATENLTLENIAANFPDLQSNVTLILSQGQTNVLMYLRNGLLNSGNPLTCPNLSAIHFLLALVLSALICVRHEVPRTVRQMGILAVLRDEREQKSESAMILRAISVHALREDDEYWVRSRKEILWLRHWTLTPNSLSEPPLVGALSCVTREYVESEMLKAMLLNSRFKLAQELYDGGVQPLSPEAVQATVHQAALHAFDNASNPNRTRGGLKKCNDMYVTMHLTLIISSIDAAADKASRSLYAFPRMVEKSLPGSIRIEHLLKATHALSDYRLVLKQGEPFSPVVLHVHSDPISIIEKVLEQNPQAYTRLQEFLDMGVNMVGAGLPFLGKSGALRDAYSCDQDTGIRIAQKRIVAMCVEAALREDDFETAYSYVVSRLEDLGPDEPLAALDTWSWQAALKAGQYVRTERSQRPTHLGTASGNLDIRHLGHRMDCLAAALRIAPTCQLQEILKTFRRCEEQLDSAMWEEAAKEAAWDAAGQTASLPGTFDNPPPDETAAFRHGAGGQATRQKEEAPMSLFDLSRATARAAQRNLTGLASLQGIAAAGTQAAAPTTADVKESEMPQQPRVRRRDQLREAATGTLVSGVGWLIGANVNQSNTQAR